MRGFLTEVAEQLYSKYGAEVSDFTLVFPSRRSRIFFTEALSQVANEPLWQPKWMSLDELTCLATPLKRGDSIPLIAELYKIYSKYHKEDFDKFYFWGEILLSDFDMIDKYNVDADMLFTNVSDLKIIESDISYMTPEQLKIISFWSAIKNGKELSKEKQRFLRVWESLPSIYNEFRARLTELGISYTGMIQRSAVERLKSGEFTFDNEARYAFVGFNALTECEKSILDHLAAATTVEFFWDYDSYYTSQVEQEAGLFIRDNIAKYRSTFDISHNNFNSQKEFKVVAAASDVLQCKYASKVIAELAKSGKVDKETAIVLTNENLLTPLLYALPPEAGKINVTMGYALKQSLSYSLVERLLSLQSQVRGKSTGKIQFYYADVVALLAHPYINTIDKELILEIESQIKNERLISVDRNVVARTELLESIFSHCSDWRSLSAYLIEVLTHIVQLPYEGEDARLRVEFLTKIIEHVTALSNSLEGCAITISFTVYLSLLRRQLQSLRVPFEGEPLEGLQVMGILETRNLDFRNVIILSMNDDNFPGNRLTTPSYVPYNIRAAYGVPTPEHHEGVFAYYFYRLIQRAEKVWMVYCSHADDKTTGEPSRYIYQLDYESDFHLNYIDVGVDVNLYEQQPLEIEKSGEVAQYLARYTQSGESRLTISPSAINRYIACPLKFYLYHIAKLRSSDDLTEDIDNSMFGNILHATAQQLYSSFIGKEEVAPQIERLLQKPEKIATAVDAAIRRVCKLREDLPSTEFAGDLLLVKDIVIKYLTNGVLRYDSTHESFEVVGVEATTDCLIKLESGDKIMLKGDLDRYDRLASGALRVVDYKTGGNHLEFKSLESLFYGSGFERQGHILQTLTYSMILNRKTGYRVVPSLYYVRSMHSDNYSPLLVNRGSADGAIASYGEVAQEFEGYLKATLAELLDCSIPFRQAEDKEGTCQYCDYKDICRS